MKAAIRRRFGPTDSIEIEEVESPELVDDGVLVSVRASSLNKADWYEATGTPLIGRFSMGLVLPKTERLGTDFAGTVEAVGSDVSHLQVGDAVYGGRSGAFAEAVVVKNAVARMPSNIDFAGAATVPTAGITALQGLRDHGQVQRGQHVLINGASGGVGTFAVQIAKGLGAEVTAVCSARNVEQTLALGADRVIDYVDEDFTQGRQVYDVVFDVAGSKPWSQIRNVLASDGIDVVVGASTRNAVLGPLGFIVRTRLASMRDSRRSAFFIARFNRPDLEVLTEMIEAGQVKPVVERSFPLGEVRQAFRAFAEGNRSKTTLTM